MTDTQPKAQRELLLLGEALDVVTARQGFESPALIPLLSALIKRIRRLGPISEAPGAPDEAEAANGESGETTEAFRPAESAKPPAPPEPPEPEKSVAEAGPSETPPPRPAAAPDDNELQDRVFAADKKLADLTAAVGQLVDVLQRRRWSGGIDRRAAPRVSGQGAHLFIRGTRYPVINWSKNGVLIRTSDAHRVGLRGFDFHFVLELADETIEFQGRAKTVRIEHDTLAAEFEGLDGKTEAKITAVMRRLRGTEDG